MPILTPKTRRKEYYSDFPRDFARLPGRSDLSRKINENSVRESIRNIVLTNKGERPFEPTFGCSIRDMLFETITPTTVVLVKDRITEAVRAFEPRAQVIDVEVSGDLGSNLINISIVFRVINTQEPATLQVQVNRIR